MKIFISHAVDNYNFAKILKQILEKSKYIDEAFIFEDKKKYGKAIDKKITDEITQSDYLIAIITDDSISSASVNQELGYAQALGINKIPMIHKNSQLGFLIYGDEKLIFTKNNFKEKCLEVRKYIIQEGPKPKFSKDDGIYIQKSAHFRFEIQEILDEILDLVIYRLQIIPEKNRDYLYLDYEQRKKLFVKILDFFNTNFPKSGLKHTTAIEKHFFKLPMGDFSRFSDEFEEIKGYFEQTKRLQHNDLFPEELDAFLKFDRALSEIHQDSFDLLNKINRYLEDEQTVSRYENFNEIITKYPKLYPIPLKNYFRMWITSLAKITKSVVLLDQEIDKIHKKFGNLAMKDTFVD